MEVLKEPGVIGYGNTLVGTQPEFQKLADFLLGRTLVVDTIDHAIAIARKYRQSVRMVTLEGEVMNVGGAMSGGAFRNAGNLLGRRREMDELGKKTGQIAERIHELRGKIAEFRKKSDKNTEEYEQIDRFLQELSLQKNTLTLQKEQLLDRKKELDDNFHGKKEEERRRSFKRKWKRQEKSFLPGKLRLRRFPLKQKNSAWKMHPSFRSLLLKKNILCVLKKKQGIRMAKERNWNRRKAA
jgi:chromosome segregation protein